MIVAKAADMVKREEELSEETEAVLGQKSCPNRMWEMNKSHSTAIFYNENIPTNP
jgi:hypothetical protein